jgi:hypothetical protein
MAARIEQQDIFQFFAPGVAPGDAEVFPVWTVVAAAATSGLAAPFMDDGDAPRWRVDFTGTTGPAGDLLAEGTARLDAWQEAMPVAAERLQNFTTAYAAGQVLTHAFGAAPTPEEELALLLAELRAAEIASSFGLRAWLSQPWRDVIARFEAFLQPLLRSLTHYAWVETIIAGRWLARTVVSWKGSFVTAWEAKVPSPQARLHECALDLALASRDAWLRILLLALRGALQVATLIALPGGFLLALPAVWHFLYRVGAELGAQKLT